jgi:hypothetical protein
VAQPSRIGYQVSDFRSVDLNSVERTRFQYIRTVLGMNDRQTLGWLVRAGLTWFPTNWLRGFELIRELRDDTEGVDWTLLDDLPY